MLQGSVGSEDRVVRLNDRVGGLRRRIDAEFQLRFLAVVRGQAFKEKSSETRASSTTKGVEDEESLETSAVVCETTNFVHYNVDLLLPDSVVPTGI